MRLKALEQATSQNMVSGTCHQVSAREWPAIPRIWTFALQAKAAAAIWPRSFIHGLRPKMSSRRPVAKATRMAGRRARTESEAQVTEYEAQDGEKRTRASAAA